MNETQINGLLAALTNQRDNALNAAANAEGVIAMLREQIKQQEAQIEALKAQNAPQVVE